MGHEVRHGRIPDLDAFAHALDDGRLNHEQVQFVTTALQIAQSGNRAQMHKRFGLESGWGNQGVNLCSLVEGWVARLGTDAVWAVDLDRRYGWLEWTLGDLKGSRGSRSLASTTVRGERPLVVNASGSLIEVAGGQGMNQRITSTSECARVAEFLTGFSEDDITRAFDWSAMVEAAMSLVPYTVVQCNSTNDNNNKLRRSHRL